MFSKKTGPTSRKPSNDAFHQQRLPGLRPVLTPLPVIILYLLIGICFTAFGIALFVAWDGVVETETVRYDDDCSINETCVIDIDVDEKMEEPVYFYYELGNYYQNHRYFVRSRSDQQLNGWNYDVENLNDCSPKITKDDTGDQEDVFLPCGTIAWNFFNDTFQLFDKHGQKVHMTDHGIAWSAEEEYRFKKIPKSEDGIRKLDAQGNVINLKNRDLMVWYRLAAFPYFKKLYRVIEKDLDEGTYYVVINNSWPVDDFDGEKYVVLSTASWVGGKNLGLPVAYIIVGGLSLLLSFLFAAKHIVKRREPGDLSYVHWDR